MNPNNISCEFTNPYERLDITLSSVLFIEYPDDEHVTNLSLWHGLKGSGTFR